MTSTSSPALLASTTNTTTINDSSRLQMANNSIIFTMANGSANFATTSTITAQHPVECVMPGIYLTKNFTAWHENKLRAHGFTHIIIIDKHIQELYYPNQQIDIFKVYSTETRDLNETQHAAALNNNNNTDFKMYCSSTTPVLHRQPSSFHQELSLNSQQTNNNDHIQSNAALKFGKEFNVLNLNFGEKSYLTTVLPNCYKAVKFINKALQSSGTILVIDCNGGEQKCLTIIVAYLMYKNNISFSNAFVRLKEFYNKADLDRFYISQLYEYEPILQVQRAQLRGHSCSRELYAATLKRKKTYDDEEHLDCATAASSTPLPSSTTSSSSSSTICSNSSPTTAFNNTMEFFNDLNPLNQFNCEQMDKQQQFSLEENDNIKNCKTKAFASSSSSSSSTATPITLFMRQGAATTGGWYNWDDAME